MTLPSPPLALGKSQPMYLGKPLAMQILRMADSPYQSIGNRGETIHQLVSGGTVVTRVPNTKRSWVLPFSGMTEDTANLLVAFYAGTMGTGPFIFVDPAWRNKLGADVSSMGAIKSAISGWSALNAGALAWDGTDAAPFPQSDVMTWTGAGNTSKLILGTWSGSAPIPRTGDAPVYLPDQAGAGSLYVRTATSSASLGLTCMGVTAAGSSLSGAATTATITTTWQRLTNFAPTASTTMQYLTMQLACNTSSAPVIWIACADIQYGPTNASTLGAWSVGLGSPRVVVAGGLAGSTPRYPWRNHALQLAEA